ncbi:MAG: ATP-binding protein [Kofleriaceae bacterium]
MAPTTRDSILAEVLRQLELGEADCARLTGLCAKLAAQLPEIAKRCFERLAGHAEPGALLRDPEQIGRLRVTLTEWMRAGLLGPYDDDFDDERARIGRRHIAGGLPPQYLVTAMNAIRGEYHDRIAALYPTPEARLVSRSVDKLLDVELALMLRHDQLDAEARLVARERSAQADRVAAIQTLSAGLAHEIRNPLNSATLQLELLERRLRRGVVDPKLLEPVEQVSHELARLNRMLNEFLAFARPSELVLEPRDVVTVVREVVASERPAATARGATLEVRDTGPLPTRVDLQKLQQIIQHLVHNGVEAVTAGGRVTVTVSGDDDQIYLVIEDDGAGIPEAVQRRIYEPFFTTKDTGTGLGLSVVHNMVTLHGGTIAITSSARGTRFDVTLPRRDGA